jgi:hypothetical protein
MNNEPLQSAGVEPTAADFGCNVVQAVQTAHHERELARGVHRDIGATKGAKFQIY